VVKALRQVKEAVPSNRPAGLKTTNPFIRPKKKAGSKKLGLDLDKVQGTGSHRGRMADVQDNLRWLREDLSWAEREGRWSSARKIRRQINQELEVELYLRSSWCPECHQTFSNCQC
jgi:hypothetical protein